MQVDRRSFLKIAGVGALGAGALLGGCATPVSDEGSSGAAKITGGVSAGELERKVGSSSETFDVVVVGAGAAGLMAALELTKGGKSVAVVEKGTPAAANFAVCGGPAACGTVVQEQEGVDLSVDTMFDYMYGFSRTSVNGALLRNLVACTGIAVNDMVDLGIPFTLDPDVYGNGFRARHFFGVGGEERVAPIVSAIEEAGGTFFLSNAAEKVIMVDGVAKGVQTSNGIDVMGDAIVICTGGFLGDEDMQLEKLNATIFPLGSPLSDGTGIRMVLDAGGAWDRNFAVLGNECGAVSRGTVGTPFNEDYSNKNEHLGYWLFGGLYTDTTGERYMNEYEIAQFPLAIGGEALVRTGKSYAVMDESYYRACQNEGIFSYLGEPSYWASGPMVGFYDPKAETADSMLQEAIDQGWAAKADSIADLAKAFDLPHLEETVEAYNASCDAGVDGLFGKPKEFLKPVKTAPFYIFEYLPSAWSTNGGVKVDSHLRAMDKDNVAIPGLYVAGVDQGSSYCVPYYSNPGSSVGLAVGSGVYVAKEILGN